MFQNILINLQETLDHHEIKQGNHFFLNEFISHMDNNNNSYHYKNVNEKETGNMKQGNESKIFGTNVSLTTSKNVIGQEDKQIAQINNSLQMNTKESYKMNSDINRSTVQNKGSGNNDEGEENCVTNDDRNDDDEGENNIKYIKNSKIVEDKLNIQKYINFKHFYNFLIFF